MFGSQQEALEKVEERLYEKIKEYKTLKGIIVSRREVLETMQELYDEVVLLIKAEEKKALAKVR